MTSGAVRCSRSGETRAATGTAAIGSESGGSRLIYMRRRGRRLPVSPPLPALLLSPGNRAGAAELTCGAAGRRLPVSPPRLALI
ncbi:MAG: hypothetical protein KME26_00545 [Oscillatoria princeps RMCB-10]|nr:hypothetical protein [Oscillatoria princeps RMCB-10]